MKMENNIVKYKYRRDGWMREGCKVRAAFYQALIVKETEKNKFSLRKRTNLEQHWQILHNMLTEILETDNVDYQRGIYYEMVLSAGGTRLSGDEPECKKCIDSFEACNNQAYNLGAYQIHMSNILAIADMDIENAQLYADNLLKLLELRYGVNSWQYAKMKLHIIGEYYYSYKPEEFLRMMKKDYDYLRKYAAEQDCFFAEVLSMYAYQVRKSTFGDYELWIKRCEEAVEEQQGDEMYCLLKCTTAWVKAWTLEEQNQHEAALLLLQEAMENYLSSDQENTHIFYGCVYLLASGICLKMQNKELMTYYAQKGLAVCKELNQIGSELYYNLYNYIGINYILEQRLGEAEVLYSSCVQDIEQKFGKESENYVLYIGHLALAALCQGKSTELYDEIMKQIQSQELRAKYRNVFNNALNFAIVRGESLRYISKVYRQCIQTLKGEDDGQERTRLDVLYLMTRIRNDAFDNETKKLMERLAIHYKDSFADEQAFQYWDARAVWAWREGDIQTAVKIYENIMPEMKMKEYRKNVNVICDYIQALLIAGKHEEAREQILLMLDMLYDQMVDNGIGKISQDLLCVRVLLSMYIYSVVEGDDGKHRDEFEIERLLEQIVLCKTIEKELKSVLGKFKDKDGEMDWYYFRQAHRRLAALEMQYEEKKQMSAEYYIKRKQECLLEMAEHEARLNEKIPFMDMVHKWRFEEITIPGNAVCAEYFAYFDFKSDSPIFNMLAEKDIDEIYNYLVFVIAEDSGKKKIVGIHNISLGESLEEEVTFLLGMAEQQEEGVKSDYEDADADMDAAVEEILQHFHDLFAVPVLKYVEGKDRIYLGLDFMLHMLPMDLIFSGSNKNPLDMIMVESIRYIGEDTAVSIEKATALVVGAPKFDINGHEDLTPLPCAEMECKVIAGLFGEKAYIGREAKQKVLWGTSKDVIHIATHGNIISQKRDGVIQDGIVFTDSYLKFAGFLDWKHGRTAKDYGNGIVSGDDFLFMDLSQTKLVVLSACVSGLGYPRGLDNLHGMRWAIGTAGAENSVTALWSVSDCASAVLMILFYRNLQSMPIGKALYETKMNMRLLTVGDMKRDKILIQIARAQIHDKPDNYCPFDHWKYWAGFVCYHR